MENDECEEIIYFTRKRSYTRQEREGPGESEDCQGVRDEKFSIIHLVFDRTLNMIIVKNVQYRRRKVYRTTNVSYLTRCTIRI